MRYKYRVSKYNPECRNAAGFYEKEEWTYFAQVGTKVGGRTLTRKEYGHVEKAYLDTIKDLLNEAKVSRLQIARLRIIGRVSPSTSTLRKMQWVDVPAVLRLCRLSFREKIDLDFRVPRRMYLHFGFDFYVYIGLPLPTPKAIARAARRGIHVEEMASPYRATVAQKRI